jgi:predicted SnoaL-like aldol condensation-catalyzing enzyme
MRCGLASAVAVGWLFGCGSSSSDVPAGAAGMTTGGANGVGGSGGSSGMTNAAGTSTTSGSTSGGASSGGMTSGGVSGGGASAGGGGGSTGGSASGTGGSTAGSPSGGQAASCEASITATNRTAVAAAFDGLFVSKQVSAIDTYWADPYLQHNPIAQSGVATFRSIMGSLVTSSSFSYQRLRTLADCELAVVQGRYSGTGVIFDMFRLKDGKLMEHWDSDSNQASDAAGATEHAAGAPIAQDRAQVLSFIQQTLIDGDEAKAATLLDSSYEEHRETTASGAAAFVEYVTEDSISYSKVHHVIADGGYVFTLSEGKLGSAAYAFYDLFRVDGGKIVEHWDSRRRVPATTASGLPIF